MKRTYYDARTLRVELDEFERRYGITSAEHHRLRYDTDTGAPGVARFDSHVWAATYEEWKRLR